MPLPSHSMRRDLGAVTGWIGRVWNVPRSADLALMKKGRPGLSDAPSEPPLDYGSVWL